MKTDLLFETKTTVLSILMAIYLIARCTCQLFAINIVSVGTEFLFSISILCVHEVE